MIAPIRNESKHAMSQNTETGRKLKSPAPIMKPLTTFCAPAAP